MVTVRTMAGRCRALLAVALLLAAVAQNPALGWGGGVVVDILMGGVSIKGKTQNTIVGRGIGLTGQVTGGTPTTEEWTIPGNRVKSYTANSTSATVTNLSADDLQQSTVSFYWVDGGDGRTVTYTVTVNGQQYSASTTFNVKRPTSTLTATTNNSAGAIAVDNAPGFTAIHFGVPSANGGTPGIAFSKTCSEPSGFTGGSCCWMQVVGTTDRRKQKNDLSCYQRSGSNVCDTNCPYSGSATTEDTPLSQVDDQLLAASVDETYSMYLMYRPVGGGIWVPLRKVSWYWNAHAERDGDEWSLLSSGHPTNPASSNCTTHPTWSGNFTGLTYISGSCP